MADFEIPNQFEDGQVTSASQMNENFQALKSEIEALKVNLRPVQKTKVNLRVTLQQLAGVLEFLN